MVSVKPIKLSGNWPQGYALDVHSLSSKLVGYDEYGHEVFDTTRSEIRDLLYRLEYKTDKLAIADIVDAAVTFFKTQWKIADSIEAIVPVPPSRIRVFQPVLKIAKGISLRLNIPFHDEIFVKTRETAELKNIYEYESRLKLSKKAYGISNNLLNGKSILLIDDLYRSGSH